MKDISKILEEWMEPGFCRRLIRLKSGEEPPATLTMYELPEGFRLETDDELRERILQSMPK